MATNETTSCPLCRHEHVKIFAVGDCSHPVCFLCSVKMRILCEETYCAICRQDLSRVFFVSNLAEAQGKLDPSAFSPIDDSGVCGIFYPTKSEWIRRKAEKLLRNFCPMCGTEFESFDVLRQHVQKQHRAFYCDLCVEHLNLFPHERKYYTRSELVQHLRNGDRDDKSMRGHPLCEFCNDHFLDNDQLYKHMRQEHYYCHLCSSNNVYYSTFELLRDHYRSAHYLCEIDQCRDVQFTNVFPNEFEFRAHQAAQHSKNRAAARQLGKVQVEFQSSNSRDRRQQEGPTQNERDETNREGNVATNVPSIDEFPTLGQSGSSTQASSHQRGAWAGEQRGNHLNEDFPALTNVASTSGQPRGFWRENPTQSTTSKTTPAVKTVPDSSSSFKAREDFPALQPAANARIPPPVSLVSAWSNAKKSAKTGNGASKKNYQPQMRMNSNRILNDNEEDEEWIRRPMATLMTSSAPQVSSNITMISSSEVNSTATTTNKNQTVPKSQDFPALPTTVRAAARSPVPSGVWTANATAAAPPASSQSKKKSGLSSKKKFLDEIKAMSTETTTTTDQPVVRLTEIGRQLITEETPEVKKDERPSSAPSTTETPNEKKTTTPSKKKKSPKATTSNDTPAEKQPSTSPKVVPTDSNLPQNRTTSSKPVESVPIVETTLPVSTPSAPPPPGFSASAGSIHPPPGFDIASASQPSYIFSSTYDQEKEAFQAKLVKLFDGDMNLFTEYDRFCQAFAEKNINSTAFLSFTRELFQEKFNDYLLELIVLIPNIDQQNELYALWKKENPSSGATASNWTKKPSAGSEEISQCHRCQQLMFASQADEHKTHHSDFNADFPSLPAASVSLVRSKGKKSK